MYVCMYLGVIVALLLNQDFYIHLLPFILKKKKKKEEDFYIHLMLN